MKTFGILKVLSLLFIVLLMVMPVAASAQEGQTVESREALTQMLAPIALYPDVLLSQVLMASTYPLEIVEANRWINENPTLTGDNLDEYLKNKDWDASVKAICHDPKLLSLMSNKLNETTRIGNAFLAQKDDVMAVIQDLRSRAYNDGNLYSNDKQTVVVESSGNIVIEPADTQVVYVPYYNTRYVYGDWWYPAWPPWYWGPDDMVVGTGIYFWPNTYLGFGLWSYFDWPDRTIIVGFHHRPHYFHRDYNWRAYSGRWHYNPYHGRGIRHNHRSTDDRVGRDTFHYGRVNSPGTTTRHRNDADRSRTYVRHSNHFNGRNNLPGVRRDTGSSIRSGETRHARQFENRGIVNHRKAVNSAERSRNRNWTIANRPVNRRNSWNSRAEARSRYNFQEDRNDRAPVRMWTRHEEHRMNHNARTFERPHWSRHRQSFSSSRYHSREHGDSSHSSRRR